MENIQAHLMILELAYSSSLKIRTLAEGEDIVLVESETENRERIVNILAQIQHKIEEQVDQLTGNDLADDSIPILKSWFNDLAIWTDKMTTVDAETVELLSAQKEKTTQEIVAVFQNKEKFKGYSLSNKK
jgi:hypothetical protein